MTLSEYVQCWNSRATEIYDSSHILEVSIDSMKCRLFATGKHGT